jgi:hypothetical protein
MSFTLQSEQGRRRRFVHMGDAYNRLTVCQ